MHLPEPATVKICQKNAGNDTSDGQASVADIGLRHLDRLTLQAPVLCAGMKFARQKNKKMKYNETADADDGYTRSGDEAINEPSPAFSLVKSTSGLNKTMNKRLSKLFVRATEAVS